jgi:hypothetical protein
MLFFKSICFHKQTNKNKNRQQNEAFLMFSIIRSTNRLGSNTPKQNSSIANNKEMNLGLILFLASQLGTQKLQSTYVLLLLPELPNGSFQTWAGEFGVCTREEDRQTS